VSHPNEPFLEWHYARRALPGYAELDRAGHALCFAVAAAELTPDEVDADTAVFEAYLDWHEAFVEWLPHTKGRMPVCE